MTSAITTLSSSSSGNQVRKATAQEAFELAMTEFKHNPLAFIKVMFDAEPTLQQLRMMNDVVSDSKCRVAVKSCTSSGKTCMLAWLILWALAVEDDIRILATAPTFPLLNRVLKTEIEKWMNKMPPNFREMYDSTRDCIKRVGNSVHRCDFATASAENEQALAGGHSGNYWIVCDEGSAISDEVYEVLLGTLSYGSGGRFVIVSNPTRSVGFYFDLFTQDNPFWKLHTLTAFGTPHVDEAYIEEVRQTYGEDHDFYRVRILGEFPKAASTQFITSDEVDLPQKNDLQLLDYHNFPKVGSIDVARFGDDDTVFVTRQGPKILDISRFRGLNTMEVAAQGLMYWKQHGHQVMFVDGTGLGSGVVDRGLELGMPIVDVVVGNKSSNPKKYVNLRAQLWGSMKEWLANGADIPFDADLKKQLLSMEYGYNGRLQIQMMSKKELKKKHSFSPDIPDAIALSFAEDAFLTTRKGGPTKARQVRMGSGFLYA